MIANALEDSHRAKQVASAEFAGTLRLKCPVCARGIGPAAQSEASRWPFCAACGFTFENLHGIWKALSPAREEQLQGIRAKLRDAGIERECAPGCAYYYLALPFDDPTGRNSRQWKIHGRSYRFFESKILPVLRQWYPGGMDVLDAGAGNCWMSYRLSLRGHRLTALDVCADDFDGLGAARHYLTYCPQPFPRFQAEMSRLPFENSQFDVVIFNASFHFSHNYQRTLQEALRCLRLPGHIFIMDSPLYRSLPRALATVEQTGERVGKCSGPEPEPSGRGYLTPRIMDDLAVQNHLAWKKLNPWRGARWAFKPLKARLLGRNEPPRLFIFWATVGQA